MSDKDNIHNNIECDKLSYEKWHSRTIIWSNGLET